MAIAEVVEFWKRLLVKFPNAEQRERLSSAETRHNNAVTNAWFAANVCILSTVASS